MVHHSPVGTLILNFAQYSEKSSRSISGERDVLQRARNVYYILLHQPNFVQIFFFLTSFSNQIVLGVETPIDGQSSIFVIY
jgi:hypothetical protein